MDKIIDNLSEVIAERMDKPMRELEKQPFFKDTKQLKNNLFDQIYDVIDKENKDKSLAFEDLLGETETLHSYYETLHYIVGIFDGLKIVNTFKHIF